MSNPSEHVSRLSPAKRALLALEQMQAELNALKQSQREPIAIIGMGCRFPGGVSTPEHYWSLLRDGVDAITEVPKTRWDWEHYYDAERDKPGKIITKYGGFIEQVDQFDAPFFRITPREAKAIDPQQRLLLEVSWEALERAALEPAALVGSETGVFVGISFHDYEQLQLRQSDDQEFGAYFASGTLASILAGRLSYFWGLQGPSMVIDTACSSSLVAVHLACQSLRNGESNLALAGGVNLLFSPQISIGLSKAGMLSPDGRCKTFDASANGYVRREGCGIIVLKRLSQALADNDTILAVIRGSAVNQDGASNGLTAPNGLAQEVVLKKALLAASVDPHELSYIEAHGTGTPLGDPIEVKALEVLEVVYGQGRSADKPLVLGSVKSNVGHTEAATQIHPATATRQRSESTPHARPNSGTDSGRRDGMAHIQCGQTASSWGQCLWFWGHQCSSDCRGGPRGEGAW